jgi:hypothetical protein
MKRTAALIFALVLVGAGSVSTTAGADPLNANSLPISFACDGGLTYTGSAIAQNHSSTGHVIASSDPSLLHSVFQAVQITVDGQIVKQIPGFEGRSLISCTIVAIGGEPIPDTIVTTGFFTG